MEGLGTKPGKVYKEKSLERALRYKLIKESKDGVYEPIDPYMVKKLYKKQPINTSKPKKKKKPKAPVIKEKPNPMAHLNLLGPEINRIFDQLQDSSIESTMSRTSIPGDMEFLKKALKIGLYIMAWGINPMENKKSQF